MTSPRQARSCARVPSALVFLALGLTLGLAEVAEAYVPPAKRVAVAVAKGNRAAKRDRALECRVALLRAEGGEAVAEGTLWTAPDGRSRLELVGPEGIERHLRRGMRLDSSRDGRAAARAPLRLPPLHLLQAKDGATLQKALAALGAPGGAIELGYDGPLDAYVLGGRGGSALWIDTESLLPARIDLPGGSAVRLGPVKSFDGILWPGWMEIQSDAGATTRLEFLDVRAASPPAGAFGPDWLLR